MPLVEICLGDNRGNQLVLPIPTWRKIGELMVKCGKFSNSKVIKLSLSNTALYLKLENMNNLFNFERCTNHRYSWLHDGTDIVRR